MSVVERAWALSSSRLYFSGGWVRGSCDAAAWKLSRVGPRGRQAHPQRQAAKVAIVSFRAGPAREGHMWLVRSWLIGFIAAISLLAQGASKAEPVKIRVSWIAPLSNWASLLMEKKEIARHMGRTYILEPVRYAGTPQMITALASNELEIANLAFSTLPIAIH